jgi:hypothetical protein
MADPEPSITVNGTPLTVSQAMTIRVALQGFAAQLHNEGLGDDDHGRTMTAAYLAAVREINALMRRQ